MISDGGLLEDIRRTGRVREQQRILQQAGRNAEEREHTPGHLQGRRKKNHTRQKNNFFMQTKTTFNFFWEDNFQLDRKFQQQQTNGATPAKRTNGGSQVKTQYREEKQNILSTNL
jgi:hypothetical protein